MKKKKNSLTIRNSTAEFLIFTSQANEGGIEVRVEDENVWLTQKLIAKLFDVHVATINEHLKNIFNSDELDENSVIREFLITAGDGKNYNTKHYNLEAIIALGYRINSERATNFRGWATRVLKDFTLRGYVLDDGAFGVNYQENLWVVLITVYRPNPERWIGWKVRI